MPSSVSAPGYALVGRVVGAGEGGVAEQPRREGVVEHGEGAFLADAAVEEAWLCTIARRSVVNQGLDHLYVRQSSLRGRRCKASDPDTMISVPGSMCP
jgi:hypothetical protein